MTAIFVLSICIGYMVIWNVTPALHTPLMSVTNAISGIIVIGGMLSLRSADGSLLDGASFCGWLGVFFASINVIGGFVVTQRMLNMFRRD
jgi:NAD(P) transhydrogenase subunit alpha